MTPMRVPALVTVVSLAVFSWTACRTVFFGDSGELIAAAHSLGVAHPPGYPLYTWLGKAALLVPLGEPALRMNLLSAFFGALCCGGIACLVQRWTGSAVAAVAAGLALAFSPDFWRVSTVAEVYTLHLALVVGLLVTASLRRGGLPLAVVLGLGLSHRPTLVLALPAAAILLGPRLREALRRWPSLIAVAALIPVVLYGAMMLRSRAGPLADWGHPADLQRLVAHVTTRQYGVYAVGLEGWLSADGWLRLGRLLWQAFPWGASLLALLGVGLGLRSSGDDGVRPAAAVVGLALPAALFGLSYRTPDVEVLFLPLSVATALAVGLGLGTIARWRPELGPRLAALLALAVVVTPAARYLPSRDLRQVTAAADYGRDMLRTLPAGAVLFVEGDDAFLLAHRLQVLGERPDVTVYDRKGLLFLDETTEAGSAIRAGESALGFRIRREQERALGEGRPVLFMSWPGYELPPGLRFEPWGLFYRVRRSTDPPGDSGPLWDSYAEEGIRRQARRIDDANAVTVAASYALMRGEAALERGDRTAAATAFDEASELARDSESIHNYLGAIHARLGDYTRAIGEFERAIRAQPVSVRAWNNLALASALAGDRQGARRAWRRSLELSPGQPDVREQLLRLD